MKILLVGANKNNSTDGVIVRGIYNLLDKAYGKYESDYVFLKDTTEMELIDLEDSWDVVVVCGTPWLWDSFQNSVKYENLQRVFDAVPSAKRVFMGIGTCIHLDDIGSDILRRPEEIQGMKNLFSMSTVIVRDRLSKTLLENAGIESDLLPCPAYFCYDEQNTPSKTSNVVIWCDPRQTISASGWQDDKKYQDYCKIFVDFYKKHQDNIDVYCANSNELAPAIMADLPMPMVLEGYQHTMDIMRSAKNVLSGRVHCAVPAYSAGCNVNLVPIDTRALMFGLFEKPLDYKEKYLQILRNVVE